MTIPDSNKLYPRTGDPQTIYLKNAITRDSVSVGDYTMYNDYVHDPRAFEKNNVLYHYPVNHDRLIIGRFCSIACGAAFSGWLDNGHSDLGDPNCVILKIALMQGVLLSHGTRYDIDFTR